MKPSWYKAVLWVHTLALLAFLIWYFFFEGYLGMGYGELIYVGMILAAFAGLLFLIFKSIDKAYTWLILGCLLIMDFWLFQLLRDVRW